MKGAVLILRPQPGANETAERARARGLEPVVAPLFTVSPIEWEAPQADRFQAILFTSANAVRQGGPQLGPFRDMPCYAVGEATAAAARDAGFSDVRTGPSDGAAVVELMAADGVRTAFHPGAAETVPLVQSGVTIEHVPVYTSAAVDRLPDVADSALRAGAIVLLHSPRAASTFSEHVGERRERARIAAISDAAAAAAGSGWAAVGVATHPRDDALLDAAAELCAVEMPPPAAPTAPAAEPSPPPIQAAPKRRSWAGIAILILFVFILGAAAMVWVLSRFEGVRASLGLAPQEVAGAPAAPPPPAGQQALQPSTPRPNADTIVIDPDVARRVAQLEQRIGELGTQSQAAVGNADRAEGLLVAFAARRALERGVGLGYLEGLLRQRFGQSQPRAVETVIAAAAQPVTLEMLRQGLTEAGPALIGAPPNQSFLTSLRTEFANLIVLRRENTPPTDPRERLRRAASRLEAGQVEVALAEVLRLPGRDNGRAWIDMAQRYVTARQALDALEVAALLEPRMTTPTPVQAPAPGEPQPPAAPAAR